VVLEFIKKTEINKLHIKIDKINISSKLKIKSNFFVENVSETGITAVEVLKLA
jgi:hypothetical protein